MSANEEFPPAAYDWGLADNLAALPEDEDVVVDCLLTRLERGQIYTWAGPLLLALNPCNETSPPSIYNNEHFARYIDNAQLVREELPPHIFAMAAKAHYNVTQSFGRRSQVIVISGETGTGKTFNACKCLEFLNCVNEKLQPRERIMPRISDACRLVSAFTTACTERNEVSSRHGQLVRLQYNGDGGAIVGAAIDSFLLERSRVTKGASNFQIFYQMMSGLPEDELHVLGLSREQGYSLLNAVGPTKEKCYADNFQDTLKAFESLNFGQEEKARIFEVLALLVHMNDIRFVDLGENCTVDLGDTQSRRALENTCQLSGLSKESVVELLTQILIRPHSIWRKSQTYHRNLPSVAACRNRLHSIIRHLYDLLFQWMLGRINSPLSSEQSQLRWLGILDIFGFESFSTNGMEQLCVNYANEKMQHYFMESYLESTRKELVEENFVRQKQPLQTIELYKERISVLEENLFTTLNDASQSTVNVDETKMIDLACGNSRKKERKFLRERDGNFVVSHYAEPVAYSIKDLLSKNTDKVPAEIPEAFSLSGNKFLRSLVNFGQSRQTQSPKAPVKKTMLAKLKYSMNHLIKELNKCDLYYVRCVKPRRLEEYKWDRNDFRKQLAYTAVFDALPLAKCKYPVGISYEEFCKRYSKKQKGTCNSEETCKLILESVAPRKKLCTLAHCGKRSVFLTDSMFLKLEHFRHNYRTVCANRIKKFWRQQRQKALLRTKCAFTSMHPQNEDFLIPYKPFKISAEENEETDLCNAKCDYKSFSTTNKFSQDKKRDINGNAVPQFKDQFVMDCLMNIVRQANTEAQHGMNADKAGKAIRRPSSESKNTKYTLHYDKERSLYTIQLDTYTLFYKNRILSRRCLATVPIHVNTRVTRLITSYILPRSELPQGLQDCL